MAAVIARTDAAKTAHVKECANFRVNYLFDKNASTGEKIMSKLDIFFAATICFVVILSSIQCFLGKFMEPFIQLFGALVVIELQRLYRK